MIALTLRSFFRSEGKGRPLTGSIRTEMKKSDITASAACFRPLFPITEILRAMNESDRLLIYSWSLNKDPV